MIIINKYIVSLISIKYHDMLIVSLILLIIIKNIIYCSCELCFNTRKLVI